MAALAVAATGATPPSAIKLRRNLLPAHGVQISNSLVWIQLNIADMQKQSRAWCSALIWCCRSLMPVHSTFISIALNVANAVEHRPPWQFQPGRRHTHNLCDDMLSTDCIALQEEMTNIMGARRAEKQTFHSSFILELL